MSLLSLERFTYRYPGHTEPALRSIDLEVAPGEFCVLVGDSASGKSTLLRAACGLVPHFHGGTVSGRAVVGGLDTREHGPGDLGGIAGALFQDPETQLVMGQVRAELALPLENRGLPEAAVARGVEEVALALGIEGLLDRRAETLSGGEQQRVALGAALVGRPALLLLDEPTSQLDPVAGDELIWLLRRLNQEWETTILLVEHRLERCLAAADRVIVLDAGTIVCDAPPAAFLEWATADRPQLVPPSARLLALLGVGPPPVGVRQARGTLRAHGLLGDIASTTSEPEPSERGQSATRERREDGGRWRRRRSSNQVPPAVRVSGLWLEIERGPTILRGIDLELAPGERVALMGRNGAGKSTLLRALAGLRTPSRGRIEPSGRVALLLQNPGDYLIHERVDEEAPLPALRAVGLEGQADRHPSQLSGGQRQRLAIAIATGGAAPAVLALDEPTRGMDRASRASLLECLDGIARDGVAVLLATHDVEFAAELAERVVLLADGRVIVDAPTSEVLCGGWYFTTETARVLGGAGGALLPEDGAALVRQTAAARRLSA